MRRALGSQRFEQLVIGHRCGSDARKLVLDMRAVPAEQFRPRVVRERGDARPVDRLCAVHNRCDSPEDAIRRVCGRTSHGARERTRDCDV